MAWLYVPGLLVSISGSDSSPPLIEQSATWRGTSITPLRWRLAWKRGILRPLLSTLTSRRSTRFRGVASWISSLRASRVNHTPLPAKCAMKKTNDTSGRSLRASLASATQLSFSWRTTRFERLSSRGETFEDWASTCRVPSRVPPPSWVQDILGGESSFLPTATANHSRWAQHDGKECRTLAGMSRWLPTTSTGHGTNHGGAAGRVGPVRPSLDRLLATPRAGVHDQPGEGPRHPTLKNQLLSTSIASSGGPSNGPGRAPKLKAQLLGTVTATRGGVQKRDGRRGLRVDDQIGGFVNPSWKELFCGLPCGWTEL